MVYAGGVALLSKAICETCLTPLAAKVVGSLPSSSTAPTAVTLVELTMNAVPGTSPVSTSLPTMPLASSETVTASPASILNFNSPSSEVQDAVTGALCTVAPKAGLTSAANPVATSGRLVEVAT